jgi:hypothetical protein
MSKEILYNVKYKGWHIPHFHKSMMKQKYTNSKLLKIT